MLKRFLIASLLAGFASNLFLYQLPGQNSILLVGFIALIIGIVGYGIQKVIPYAYLVGIVCFFGLLSLVRASGIVQTLLFGGMFFSLFLVWYLVVSQRKFVETFWETITIPIRLFVSYLQVLFTSESKLQIFKHQRFQFLTTILKNSASPTFLGVIIGFPIIVILFMLLSSADPIFERTIQNFLTDLSLPNFGELGIRFVVAIGVFFFTFQLAFMKLKQQVTSPAATIAKPSSVQPFAVVMIMTAAVLGVFLAIQWPYVFAVVNKEQNLTQFGISTYSEYVTRGFGEFLVIASFLYGLLWIGYIALRQHIGKRKPLLFYAQTAVVILFAIFLVSIFRRILLYWEFHGLTLIRFYGGVFLLWVGLLTTTLYARSLKHSLWIRTELIISAILLTLLGLGNVEQFIVKNHPPTVNTAVDTVYLSRLSADGYEGWKQAYTTSSEIVSNIHMKSGILDAEDRRKLAQAGLSLGILNNTYHDFLMRYGSQEEQQAASDQIVSVIKLEVDSLLDRYEVSLELLKQKGNKEPTPADQYVWNYDNNKSSFIAEHIVYIRSLQTDLEKDRSQRSIQSLHQFIPKSAFSVANFSHSSCYLLYVPDLTVSPRNTGSRCLPVFFIIDETRTALSGLELLYRFNLQEYFVYQQMKQDMPFKNFIELQKQYTFLWKKILAQPENERAFFQDISFETPLIEPL